jgi:hypothetical protein
MSSNKQLDFELAIVEFLGLGSTLDLLEDGTRKIINKGALNNGY